ncbi:crotonase/enoyl-CoA hydratase family protein [Saccharopolyspora gloriosae]|uniref:Enoyl-CoA hydratase/carnithine racemase n=1 Tax=Saccharopolyspora gloriosae TaxID=455344 RepID=A0A840NJH3_9PSEU|nr:crotonase/enoyl-CoA hydratase family protein [Saccharopolyspora gloriosae]MBB5069439.1 enoyl-CoA hydratase/carnithine racemase [Saccharopolyspora gloriosae]
MTYQQISYEVHEQVATITLNRPEKLNAFTDVMRRELLGAFDATDADDEVRAVILTGAGRAFCAGADLSSGAGTFDYDSRDPESRATGLTEDGVPRDGGGTCSLRIAASKKPVIAAVNGAAVGVGATMLLPADIRLAGAAARFGFVFARRGLVPEAASTWFLPRLVGISQAMEWAATGRIFDATEAKSGGLVSRVVPAADLLATARELAAEIVHNTAPVSVAATRRLMWSMLSADNPFEAHRLDSRAIHGLGASPDAAEGVSSFLEKRPADFPGRVTTDFPDYLPPWP